MAISLVLAHISALLVAALVLVWALGFRTNFFLISSYAGGATSVTHPDHLYSVLHYLLMVIGFILLAGEGMLAHRREAAQLWLQGAALGFAISGIWAKFKGKNGLLANFYSLHSWIGLLCLLLFAAQWAERFLRFWRKGEGRRARAAPLLPWHVFVGLVAYGLAVAAAECGLAEKLASLQAKHGLSRRSPESTFVNILGLALAILCGVVVFAAVGDGSGSAIVGSNGHRHSSSKLALSHKKDGDDRISESWISPPF
ncbi:putative transmembrane ascorbate ferrireductase 4 [Canna indica]|uniref:Transmembrane ascorbate ferrireductase 4 n=1 Tax=Canna indica TaxID=4628 RepID=A0AAQ3KP46_9LILI|nr:putative transmembrane ascorbate ferrireductase 4 [Canna indica]